ncbi:MAG: hypothetical protein SGILL_010703 [Bacillariaceae sp.]
MESSASSLSDGDIFNQMTTILPVIVLTIMAALFLSSPTRVKAAFVAPFHNGNRLLRAHCFASGMQKLPEDVVQYSQVPAKGKFFTADKIPRGLLKDHTTKAGTWGVIRVSEGKLEYTIQEPTQSIHEITPETKPGGIIEPQVKHRVKALTDDLKFVVEFYRKPGTGPVDEKREGL